MSSSLCAACGATLDAGSAARECPACLLRLGFAATAEPAMPPEPEWPTGTGERAESAGPVGADDAGIVGPFRLVRVIGEGAFGTVWEAEQHLPVRRKVALKVLKVGMDTREVIARFEAERQALAIMDHPSIARIFDGGATTTGRPYFAMELVDGLPIDRYCHRHQLGLRPRIKLLIEVCDAVQHAHQKGVIHRDLKPSNILVAMQGDRAVPKVIDFGIAKAIGSDLTDLTLFTRHNQLLGTPAYMSPEQSVIGANNIDTRTDVYSLGAILYELLTGRPPRSTVAGAPPAAASSAPGSDLPVPPSRAVRETAASTPFPDARELRAELDWIAMKALDPDRTCRYPSASELAADLRRFLANEPVLAGPPSAAYRWRKFVAKHRVAVWTGAAFLALLLVAVAVSIALAIRADRDRRTSVAAQEAELSRRLEAQEAREQLRRRVYAADMGAAMEAVKADNLVRARGLLSQHRPKPGERDLRHWEWRFAWDRSHVRARVVQSGPRRPVRSLAISATGRWLAWGDEDGRIALLDLSSPGAAPISLEAGAGDPAVVAFSPVDNVLAGGVRRGLVRLWSADNWVPQADLPQEGWIRSLAFAGGGDYLACMSDLRHVALWRPRERTLLQSVPVAAFRDIYKGRMAFAPDQARLAIGETDGTIRILRLPGLEPELAFAGTPSPARDGSEGITALAFSPDGQALVSASGYNDFDVRLWQRDGSSLGTLAGHKAWVTALAFSRDGRTLASTSVDQTVRLWDWPTRAERAVLRGHQHEASAVALSPDGRLLASSSRAGEVFLWDLRTEESDPSPQSVSGEIIRQAVFSPDSATLASWHWDGGISWRSTPALGKRDLPPATDRLPGTNHYGVAFAPEGRVLAVGTRVGSIRLIDLAGAAERSVQGDRPAGRMLPVGFSTDGHRLLGVGRVSPAPVCHLWELPSGRRIRSWPLTPGNHRVAFSGDGRWVGTGDFDGSVRLWDAESGREVAVLGKHQSEVLGLQFAPDHRTLASGSAAGDVALWDIETRAAVAILQCEVGAIYSLAFSPDGRRLVTGGNGQRALEIWDVATRQLLITLPAAGAMHENVAFSPNGNALISVNSDGVLHLWSARPMDAIDAGAVP